MTDEQYKEKIIKDVQMMSLKFFNAEESTRISNIVAMAINDYQISTPCEELSTEVLRSNDWYLQQFLAIKAVAGLSPRSLSSYQSSIKMFFRYIPKNVEEITTNDIRYFLAQKSCEGAKNSYLNDLLRALSSFFGTLTTEEYILKNPTARIPKVKEEKNIRQPFDGEEIEKMRDYKKNNARDKFILEFLLSTGCRVAEASGANLKDLVGDRLLITGKGNKQRYVYLNTKAMYALNEYMKTRNDDNPAMFVSIDEPHERLQISAFEIIIRDMGKELGIEKCYPHRFRRTVATNALRNGMPIEQVSLMLGHSSVDTTQIYARSEETDIHEAHRKYVR